MTLADYCRIFASGQYGRLYIHRATYPRMEFRVWLLGPGLTLDAPPTEELDAVLVYSATDADPAPEWLHAGRWVGVFDSLATARAVELDAQRTAAAARKQRAAAARAAREAALLTAW
jgi:hypothetical protein